MEFKTQDTLDIIAAMQGCETLLQGEYSSEPVKDLADLKLHQDMREAIANHLESVQRYASNLRMRFRSLPKLPAWKDAVWARDMLGKANMALLEVDTDGLAFDAALLRVVLLDAQQRVLFDTFIRPKQMPSRELLSITGIAQTDLDNAPTFAEVWPKIHAALTGKHLVSYGRDFDIGKLEHHAGQDMPFVATSCLMEKATSYFQSTSFLRLAELCWRVGHPLPERPNQTALDRAVGQLRVLKAMANGFTTLPTPITHTASPVSTEAGEFDEEHPF